MGPKYGVVGAYDQQLQDIPVTEVAEEHLKEEKAAARFSKTAEFKKLREHFESRISFYQAWLPDGRAVQEAELSDAELGSRWRTANTIINEFNLVLGAYERAGEAVEDANRRSDN